MSVQASSWSALAPSRSARTPFARRRMNRTSRLLTALALVSSLAWAGCDGFSEFVDDPLGDFSVQLDIPDARFELDGLTVPVAPDRPLAFTVTERTDFGDAAIDGLSAIRLNRDAFSFDPFFDGATPSGSFAFYMFIDGVPLPNAPLTVTVRNGAVSDVTPTEATAASQVDLEKVTALAQATGTEIAPDLAGLSGEQILDRIRASLSTPRVKVAVATEPLDGGPMDDPLLGGITLSEIRVDVLITP